MKLRKPNFFETVFLLTLFLLFIATSWVFAQQPGIPYQAYIIDTEVGYVYGEKIKNVPMANKKILLQFEVRNDRGQVEYIEEIPVTTDQFGLVSTVVGRGRGTATFNSFSDIKWDGTEKTLHTYIDFTNTGGSFDKHGEMSIIFIPGPAEDAILGLYRGNGPPTAADPTNPVDGSIYVDQSTGFIHTFTTANNAWESQRETTTALALKSNHNGTPNDPTDDFQELIFTDELGVDNAINISSLIKADNGLTVNSGTVELGGTLTKPTTITTSAANPLALQGLEDAPNFDPSVDQVMIMDQPSGVLKRAYLASVSVQRETVVLAANDGDTDFDTPLAITDPHKINVFRNGVRVSFTQVDADTIRLENEATCYAGDQIRIVQLH